MMIKTGDRCFASIKSKTRYEIATCEHPIELADLVNKLLESGRELYGQPFVTTNNGTWWAQAMVLHYVQAD